MTDAKILNREVQRAVPLFAYACGCPTPPTLKANFAAIQCPRHTEETRLKKLKVNQVDA